MNSKGFETPCGDNLGESKSSAPKAHAKKAKRYFLSALTSKTKRSKRPLKDLPFVFSNLAITVDGKIAPADRSFFPLGTTEDLRLLEELRGEADAVLFGASTLRTFKKPCIAIFTEKKPKPGFVQPANVVVSSQLEGMDPSWPFFKDRKLKRVLIVSAKCPEERLKPFRKTCTIIRENPEFSKTPALGWIRALQTELKIKRLLVEGGGGIMWNFVQDNLIDHYYVTLTPRILGGVEAPTLVDGKGHSAKSILDLTLLQCRRVGDELYLIYQKKQN